VPVSAPAPSADAFDVGSENAADEIEVDTTARQPIAANAAIRTRWTREIPIPTLSGGLPRC